tara:strand:- start:10473 stop:11204 length:732 start_codon:yes stop_codon:yes gene_type:complete
LTKKVKKKIRRRRSGKRNMYFTMDTQAAIVEYQNSESQEEKEDLYNKQIKYAFEKLVENLIFVYGFHNPYENTKHMQSDCVSFLFETIHKWKKEKGTKAFSYFNVVAKNWLIMNSKKRQKRIMRHVSFENRDLLSIRDKKSITYHQVIPSADTALDKIESRQQIIEAMKAIKDQTSVENELSCINAIITMFENVETLDFLNKRAVFVYVREISGLDRKQLSKALSAIRIKYGVIRNSREFDMF